MRRLVTTLIVAWVPLLAAAQQTDPLEPGRQAFREERFADAARIFERVASEDPRNAEAHFLVARVYFETPLKDPRKARRSLDRALELEPENVEFLVGRLQQLRTESWNFVSERLKEARRLEVSRKILKLDPDNAFAHEELGLVNIRDFWRYRNAIMLPTLDYGYQGTTREADQAPLQGLLAPDQEGTSLDQLLEQQFAEGNILPNVFEGVGEGVFLSDRFDLEALKDLGVPVADLSGRADRAYERAIGHLQKALEVDPRRRSVYDEMMQIFVLKGEYEDALVMLQEMERFFPEDPDLWRYLGLVQYELDDLDAADNSFLRAFEYMEAWEVTAYEDIDLFLSPDERKLREQDPVAFNARFWTSQDPRYLTPYNERKLEHYVRLTEADLLYGSEGLNLRGWETERGRILARYGRPMADVVLVPSESGLFSARTTLVGAIAATVDGTDDVGLSTSGLAVQGANSFGSVLSTAREAFEELNTYNIWEYGTFRFVFEDPFRNGEYRFYSPPAEFSATQLTTWQNDYEIKAKETFNRTPQLYEYEAPGRQIELPFQSTVFKGEEPGTSTLYVHYGIPINEFDPSEDMIEITANTGTFLVSAERDMLVERRNRLYGLRTDQVMDFREQSLWIDTKKMQAPPGAHDLSLEFETVSGQTVAMQRREITVDDFSDGDMALSDMLLAYRVTESPDGTPLGNNEIVRDGLSILPAPWPVYATEWPIYLYFEIYGLELDEDGNTDYDVEITLTPKDEKTGVRRLVDAVIGGGDAGVSVSYHGSGTSADETLYQILDASQEAMGLYELELRVRDNIGRGTATRQRDLFLEE